MVFKPFNEDIKPPNIILVGDDYLEDAVRTISGYCKKHRYCEGCRFKGKFIGACFFQDNIEPPCDWKMPEESEVTNGEHKSV